MAWTGCRNSTFAWLYSNLPRKIISGFNDATPLWYLSTHSVDHIPARYAFLFSNLQFRSHHYYVLWKIETNLFKHSFLLSFFTAVTKGLAYDTKDYCFLLKRFYQIKATQYIFICYFIREMNAQRKYNSRKELENQQKVFLFLQRI